MNKLSIAGFITNSLHRILPNNSNQPVMNRILTIEEERTNVLFLNGNLKSEDWFAKFYIYRSET